MTYSKLHQNKTYALEIDIINTKCPVCGRYHLHMNGLGDIICRCGFISSVSHSYCGGFKINNDISFKTKIKYKNGDELENEKLS